MANRLLNHTTLNVFSVVSRIRNTEITYRPPW